MPGNSSFTPRRAATSVLSRRAIQESSSPGNTARPDTFLAGEEVVDDSFVAR